MEYITIEYSDSYYIYDTYHIVKAMYPFAKITQVQKKAGEKEPLIRIGFPGGSFFTIYAKELECSGNSLTTLSENSSKKEKKQEWNRRLYRKLKEETGRELPWGILTGIRPTKIATKRLEIGRTKEEVCRFLEDIYLVSPEKARFCLDIAKREQEILSPLDYQNGVSVYVGIPFCPTRCSYCSFTAYPIHQWKERVDAYLDGLEKEIRETFPLIQGKKVDTLYVGGGTPTTLSPKQLERLFLILSDYMPLKSLLETTVEAGRPDSITREKLQVCKDFGIQRISINPQTMKQETLNLIGRGHTVEQIKECFFMAREMGFDNINMDLIAGLPKEGVNDFSNTLEEIRRLSPDSLTIHSLAVKRASRIGQGMDTWEVTKGKDLEEMLRLGGAFAKEEGMVPYYMYRQKNMSGNFENTGYAKVDKAGIYNILIMEEKQIILAFGAGSTSKIVRPFMEAGKQVVRMENPKDIPAYIEGIEKKIQEKKKLLKV